MANLSLAAIKTPDFRAWGQRVQISKFKSNRLSFYEDYLDSGLEMRDYCKYRAEQLEGRGDSVHMTIRSIGDRLAKGMSVANALAPYVPATDVILLSAHESRGSLDEGMAQLIESVRAENQLKSDAISALIGPTGYLIVAILVVSYGVPMMVGSMGSALLNPATMTLDQRALVGLSNFMSNFAYVLDVLYLALPAVFIASLPRWTPTSRIPGRQWLDRHFAPYAIYRSYQAALFLRALGAQLSVTPKMELALDTIRTNSNKWLAAYVLLMQDRLPRYRVRPILALDVGLLDVEMIDSLVLISMRGDSEAAINARAGTAFKRAMKTIRVYVASIGVAGKVLLGIVLAWATFSLMTQPLRQQMQLINNPTAAVTQQH